MKSCVLCMGCLVIVRFIVGFRVSCWINLLMMVKTLDD